MSRVIKSPSSSLVIRNKALTFRRYQNRNESRYLKLFDGGVTDNLGLHGIITQRERYNSPIAPFSPKQVVSLKDFLFIVVNASAKTGENIQKEAEGPNGVHVLGVVVDTLMATATSRTRDEFFLAMQTWREDIIEYRCGLTANRVRELIGDRQGWDCKDVHFDILDLNFEQVKDQRLRATLEKIPTAYVLPRTQTDLLVKSAGELLRDNPRFRDFLKRVQ